MNDPENIHEILIWDFFVYLILNDFVFIDYLKMFLINEIFKKISRD